MIAGNIELSASIDAEKLFENKMKAKGRRRFALFVFNSSSNQAHLVHLNT